MTFSISALRKTKLLNDLASKIRPYSLLISPVPYLGVGGSGTLVRYKNLFGILTATHVMADYIESEHFFSPIIKTEDPTYFLNAQIPIKKMIYLETPEGLEALKSVNNEFWPQGALDICLIQVEKIYLS